MSRFTYPSDNPYISDTSSGPESISSILGKLTKEKRKNFFEDIKMDLSPKSSVEKTSAEREKISRSGEKSSSAREDDGKKSDIADDPQNSDIEGNSQNSESPGEAKPSTETSKRKSSLPGFSLPRNMLPLLQQSDVRMVIYSTFFLGFFFAILVNFFIAKKTISHVDDPILMSLHELKLAEYLAQKWRLEENKKDHLSLYVQWIDPAQANERTALDPKTIFAGPDSLQLSQHGILRAKLDFTDDPIYQFDNELSGENLITRIDTVTGDVQFYVDPISHDSCYYARFCRLSANRIESVQTEQEMALALYGKEKGEIKAWEIYNSFVYRPMQVWIIALCFVSVYLLALLVLSDRMETVRENMSTYWTAGQAKNRRWL